MVWIHEYRKFLFCPLHGDDGHQIPKQATLGGTTLKAVFWVRVVWILSHVNQDAEWELSEISVAGDIGDRVTRTVEVMRSSDSRIQVERPEWLQVLVDGCRPTGRVRVTQ